MAAQPDPTRPPESIVLRQCPDPVDGRRAFITRQITLEHCEKLQRESFHACAGCVHAKPETVAHWRQALDVLLGQMTPQPETQKKKKTSGVFRASSDPLELELSVARNWADLEEAYCLVYRSFKAEGLPETGPARPRIDCFNRLAGARTFQMRHRGKLVGVLTVLPDSVLGLPADELYHAELKALRESKRVLCGFSSLAVEMADKRLARQIRMHLFRAAWRYADQMLKATDICTLVPARHELYYRRLFMFERLGDARMYALGGEPCRALGLRLNLEKAPEYFQSAYGNRSEPENLFLFFTRQDAQELTQFLKGVRDAQIVGQIGGPGYPTLPTFRTRAK